MTIGACLVMKLRFGWVTTQRPSRGTALASVEVPRVIPGRSCRRELMASLEDTKGSLLFAAQVSEADALVKPGSRHQGND